jgi:hypothetical protein
MISVGGKQYTPKVGSASGEIFVPVETATKGLILSDGQGMAALSAEALMPEHFSLQADICMEREATAASALTPILVRCVAALACRPTSETIQLLGYTRLFEHKVGGKLWR